MDNSSIPTTPRLASVKTAALTIDMTEAGLRKLITRRRLPDGIVVRFGRRCLRLDVEALIAWARSGDAQEVR